MNGFVTKIVSKDNIISLLQHVKLYIDKKISELSEGNDSLRDLENRVKRLEDSNRLTKEQADKLISLFESLFDSDSDSDFFLDVPKWDKVSDIEIK